MTDFQGYSRHFSLVRYAGGHFQLGNLLIKGILEIRESQNPVRQGPTARFRKIGKQANREKKKNSNTPKKVAKKKE